LNSNQVLPILIENATNKIPILRKNVLEYFCLAAALWKVEIFSKYANCVPLLLFYL
jgi:hypothetical protein